MDRDQNYVFYGCSALSMGWNWYLDGYGCLGLGKVVLACVFCFGYRVEKAEADNVYSQHKGALFVGQYLVQAAESVSIDGRTIYIVEGRRERIESEPVPRPTSKEDEIPGKLATASSGVLAGHAEITTRKKGLDRMAILQKSFGFFLHVEVSLGNFYEVIKYLGKYFEAIREGVSEAVFSLNVVLPSVLKSFLITHLLRRFQS
ncbi:hypothetical protein, partial [Kistimonas scapharcae]|uniref:hypothetical protein n=1 Tax=Kistimonas scapharcae TaxID=1036133 RepID=UPI0031F03CB8